MPEFRPRAGNVSGKAGEVVPRPGLESARRPAGCALDRVGDKRAAAFANGDERLADGGGDLRRNPGTDEVLYGCFDGDIEAAEWLAEEVRQDCDLLGLRDERPAGHLKHLFGEGWRAGRYRFGANGSVIPAWSGTCTPAAQ